MSGDGNDARLRDRFGWHSLVPELRQARRTK